MFKPLLVIMDLLYMTPRWHQISLFSTVLLIGMIKALTSYRLVQKGLLVSSAETPLSATSTRCALSQLKRKMTPRFTIPNSCRSLQVSCLHATGRLYRFALELSLALLLKALPGAALVILMQWEDEYERAKVTLCFKQD